MASPNSYGISHNDADTPFGLAWRMTGYQRDSRYIQAMCRREYGKAPSVEQIDAMFADRARHERSATSEHLISLEAYNPENDNGDHFRVRSFGKSLDHMIRVNRNIEWDCGHHKTDLNTHRVGELRMCRVCRRARLRKRIRAIYHRETARLAIVEARAAAAAQRRKLESAFEAQKTIAEAGRAIEDRGRLPFDDLVKAVAAHFDITPGAVRGHGRKRKLIHARAVVVQILRSRGLSFPTIGRLLGGRDHSTVIHAFEHFPDYCDQNATVSVAYRACKDRVGE